MDVAVQLKLSKSLQGAPAASSAIDSWLHEVLGRRSVDPANQPPTPSGPRRSLLCKSTQSNLKKWGTLNNSGCCASGIAPLLCYIDLVSTTHEHHHTLTHTVRLPAWSTLALFNRTN